MNAGLRWSERSGDVALVAFLLFLIFPVRELLDSSAGTAHVVLVLAGLAAFVGVYLSLMTGPARPFSRLDEWLRFGVMLALALAIALDDTAEWATLFIFVAAVAGLRLPPDYAVTTILACACLAAVVGAIGDYSSSDLIAYTLYVLAIGFLLLTLARLLHAREEIARLAVTDERLRFARDLHDLLGHSLSVIALKSELASRLLPREPDRAAVEMAEIEQVAREALEQVRETVTGYRRMTLTDELAGARMALSAAGIEASIDRADVPLGPETEAILAWAVREGTTNVIRHSGASRCEIRIQAGPSSAEVEVLDDGLGGDRCEGGSGLAGLAERASRRRGHLEAGPRPGGGFRLRVSVPAA